MGSGQDILKLGDHRRAERIAKSLIGERGGDPAEAGTLSLLN